MKLVLCDTLLSSLLLGYVFELNNWKYLIRLTADVFSLISVTEKDTLLVLYPYVLEHARLF